MTPARRSTPFNASFSDIAADFSKRGIPTDAPGFFDHPMFVAEEQKNVDYLNNYARFVALRPLEAGYEKRALRDIPEIARVLHRELVSDGRLGACIDITMMLGKALNREGFWNYQTKGGLTIEYADHRIATKYFWPRDVNRPVTGHSWLVAPPFAILDLSIRRQPHKEGADQLPDLIIAEKTSLAKGTAKDVLSPEIRASFRKRGIANDQILHLAEPHIPSFWDVFPPQAITIGGVTLKYVATGIAAPETPIDIPGAWECNGRPAGRMYEEVVRPHLDAIRGAGSSGA